MTSRQDNSFLGSDERVKKAANSGREPRAQQDVQRQVSDGTAFTVEERRKMLRNEWVQEALPSPPEIPGYHLCWLSTTNTYDSIHKRMRWGYEPVKASEVPGFEHLKAKGGEWDGFVAVNEMLLFKIPTELYEEIMNKFHNEDPLEQEAALKQRVDMGEDSQGRSLGQYEGDGLQQLGKGPLRTTRSRYGY